MDQFDDFDIGPQSDEFVPSYFDEVADFYGIDEIDLEECDLLDEDEAEDGFDAWNANEDGEAEEYFDWDSFDFEDE